MSGIEEAPVIVIDNGSYSIKSGFAGEEEPRSEFRAMGNSAVERIYRIRSKPERSPAKPQQLHHPTSHGTVTDWGSMQQVLQHVFSHELRADPSQHAVLISEPALSPKACRESTLSCLFESFGVPGAYVASECVLCVYSSGRGIALALSCGHDVTHAAAVYEGYSLPHAVARCDFAGRGLTALLAEQLLQAGYAFSTGAELELVRQVKEQLCYVAADFGHESAEEAADPRRFQGKYTLPDGQELIVGDARFRCPEALFRPQLCSSSSCSSATAAAGIHSLVWHSISQCDLDLRRDLLVNIVISGGTSQLPGFADRLQAEVCQLAPARARVKVVAPPDRQHSAWIGGSILGSLSTFQPLLITRADYDEHGPGIVHRKCY